MEAETQGGLFNPTPAVEESRAISGAKMRSSQMPALEPEAQEGQEPSYKWTDGHRHLMAQPKGLAGVGNFAPESSPFFFAETSTDLETGQEDLVVRACEHQETAAQSQADSPAKTVAHTIQGEWLDSVPISSELGNRVEVELQPQLTSLTLETSQTIEVEADSAGFEPCCQKLPTETHQTDDPRSEPVSQGKLLQWKGAQESQGQKGFFQLLEFQEEQEVEFQEEETLGEDNCSDGQWAEQKEMVERVGAKEEQQLPEQVQEEEKSRGQGERGRDRGDLEGLDYGERGPEVRERSDLEEGELGDEELRGGQDFMDSEYAEDEGSTAQAEEVSGKQEDHGQVEKVLPGAEQEEEEEGDSSEGEPRREKRGQRAAGEERERCRGSPVAWGTHEVLPPCALFEDGSCHVTKKPGIQRDPTSEEATPRALMPALDPTGGSSQPSSPPDSFLTPGSLDSPGTELVFTSTSVTPPWMSHSSPFSPASDVFPASPASSSASPSTAFRERETPMALLSHDSPPSSEALENLPAVLHGVLPTETTQDPQASLDRVLPHSPLADSPGAGPHPRSSPFCSWEPVGEQLFSSRPKSPPRLLKLTTHGPALPEKKRRGQDGAVISEAPTASSILSQDSEEFTSDPERHSSPRGGQPWVSLQNSTLAIGSPVNGSSPAPLSRDTRIHELLPPEKRHAHHPVLERDGHLHTVTPTLKRQSHPSPLVLTSGVHEYPAGPLPQVPDSLVSRQYRPLPSTPDSPRHAQTRVPSVLRYNKPLPPTPYLLPFHHPPASSSSISRMFRPLPPVPITDPSSEPPPLPPKSRGRNKSTQVGLTKAGDQTKPRPVSQDWVVSTPVSTGRTSWPPAKKSEPLVPTGRSMSEALPGLAFSNLTHLLSPSSPTTPWTPELQRPPSQDEPDFTEEAEALPRGLSRRSTAQEGANGLRRSAVAPTRQPEKPSHPQLEKSSSWPHRRDPGRPPEVSSEQGVSGQVSSKHKSWSRQGLRRPSIFPDSASDSKSSTIGRPPAPADSVVFREKKPKEGTGGFSRRCSKLINSSHLLYQEYSDVVLNKEIQSQQRLDSLAESPGLESPGLASPRQPRKALVSSDSYLQRLSIASSASLWQEIPKVRNSTVLLTMTLENQKLQEAKFELIVSEASYLRSLNIAVDHFQHSTQLRAILSNQDHQWLFSRLQDVRDVSSTFLSDLEENFENDIFSFQVCDVVLNHAPDFRRVYLPYVTNQTYQDRTFQSLMNSNSSFREVLEKLESDPICQRLSLKSFLILPFQRITRLKLLLQNILKRTQPGSAEEAEATKAHHALEKLIRDCNSNVQRMRRTEELIYLSQKIEFECKIFPLISQSRWLVKSGELTALEFSISPGLRRKLNTRPVHLHLFNDCLLLSRPREGNRFLVFDHAPFSSVRGEKCEMKLHGPHKNLFRLFLRHNAQGTQAEFLFRTDTQSEKLRWISALAMPREELDLLECYDSQQVQCLRAYKPRENDELALEKADVVMVTQQSSDGWLEGVRLSDGEQGWFPRNQVEFILNPEVRARNLKEAHRVKTAKLQLMEQQA